MTNIIMKCQADKSWLTEPKIKQSDDTAYTLLKLTLALSVVFIAASIFNASLSKIEQPDYLMSSDMQSYMETIAHAEIFEEGDLQ